MDGDELGSGLSNRSCSAMDSMSPSQAKAAPKGDTRRFHPGGPLRVAGLLLGAYLAGCGEHPGPADGTHGHPPATVLQTSAPALEASEGLDPKMAAAIRGASETVDRAPEDPRNWADLGALLHAHRRFEVARTCYDQALLRDSEDARTWYYRALIEDQLGDTGRAEKDLGECIRLDPGYPPARWRLGLLLLGRGELHPAEVEMRAALAIAPHDPASVVGLARVLLQKDEGAAAVQLLESHTARLPSDINARFLLGTAYRKVGRMEDAKRLLASGTGADPVRHDPWQAALFGLRQGYRAEFLEAGERLKAGDPKGAIERLEALRERQPDDTLIQLSLHRAYRANGELDRAIDLLLETRSADPLHEMVHLHLAGAYLQKAHQAGASPDPVLLALALESSERARELSPALPGAHGMHGDILQALGESERATDDYLRAAQLEPDSILWHERSARGLCDAARWPEAVTILTELDVLQPGSGRTLFFLGAALGNLGRLSEACDALARAEQAAPGDASIATAHRRMRDALAAAGPGAPHAGSDD